MSAINRAVDAVPLVVGLLTKCFEQTLPDTFACPAVEAIEHGLPRAKIARKIPPRSARTPPPQYRFHEVAIVSPRPPGALPPAQRCFDLLPPPLIQLQANHGGRPMEHTLDSMESLLLSVPSETSARPPRAQLGAARAGKARATNLGLPNKRAQRLLTDRRARARARLRARASDPNLGTLSSVLSLQFFSELQTAASRRAAPQLLATRSGFQRVASRPSRPAGDSPPEAIRSANCLACRRHFFGHLRTRHTRLSAARRATAGGC